MGVTFDICWEMLNFPLRLRTYFPTKIVSLSSLKYLLLHEGINEKSYSNGQFSQKLLIQIERYMRVPIDIAETNGRPLFEAIRMVEADLITRIQRVVLQ